MTLLQQRVEQSNQQVFDLHERGELDKRILAISIEINQRYTEYLDHLLDSDFDIPQGVTVEVDGQQVHFDSMDSFADWVTEHLS